MEIKFHDILPDDVVPIQKPGLSLGKTTCCYFLQNKDSTPVLKLNETGALIWTQCTGVQNVGQIIAVLVEQFGEDNDEVALSITKDVLRVLDIFNVEGVITVDDSTAVLG